MKFIRFLPLFIALMVCNDVLGQTVKTSLCALQANPDKFLNSEVQVEALVFAGIENPHLASPEGKCWFNYARGDDYQSFGKRFPVRRDSDWKLLDELLGKSDCASNIRVAKAKIRGTIIRAPATGTTPPEEMPFELVIQSVSEVARVPTKCTPPGAHSPETSRHERRVARPFNRRRSYCCGCPVLRVVCEGRESRVPAVRDHVVGARNEIVVHPSFTRTGPASFSR